MSQTYAEAGVDIGRGDRLVHHIKKAVRSTFNKSVLGGIGSFGALFDGTFKGYKSPVLVSSVDGVGTKLMVAHMMNKHDTVGQDLVNHCVNDILACGARPLFFMDYFACGKLNLNVARDVIDGFVKACNENGCSLIGGETAEMPGFYNENEYDLAGTIVGVVEKKKIVDGKRIRKGDVLIGLRSTGLHTNGYSLARSVLLPVFRLDQHVDELNSAVGEALLAVHRSYLKSVQAVVAKFDVRGLSHITGGGIVGNTMRIVPKSLRLRIEWSAWDRNAIFNLIQRVGSVPEEDMRRAFNLGIGLIIVIPHAQADNVIRFLKKKGEAPVVVGEVVRR
ncbi:MAG: phosphoribosylformylglycinamidine cyclo-ligase [Bacteroidetes bacterium]|nr:phosphoribosylformylglycinamidine cyclo-ligase [Bacteroidota bacterium]MCW5895980.1 phosphoribosylformylglycinamidine cyclo-ligase [Bacteroidota bacterium]